MFLRFTIYVDIFYSCTLNLTISFSEILFSHVITRYLHTTEKYLKIKVHLIVIDQYMITTDYQEFLLYMSFSMICYKYTGIKLDAEGNEERLKWFLREQGGIGKVKKELAQFDKEISDQISRRVM